MDQGVLVRRIDKGVQKVIAFPDWTKIGRPSHGVQLLLGKVTERDSWVISYVALVDWPEGLTVFACFEPVAFHCSLGQSQICGNR